MHRAKLWGTLLLVLGMAATCAARGIPRALDQSVGGVPFRLVRGYLIVVEGTVGPLPGRHFVIDTGSCPSILDTAVASELGLRGPASRLELFNGNALAETAILSSLNLGPVTAKSLPVLVSDLSFIQRDTGVKVDAIIGLDVLRSSFVIDYEAKMIRFGAVPILPDSVPFVTPAPLITVKMDVEGAPARVLVDTGASGVLLFRKNYRFSMLQVLKTQSASNISGSFPREQVEVRDLHLGSLYFAKHIAYLASARESVSRDYDGLMGIPAMGIREIAFDFERGMLRWK